MTCDGDSGVMSRDDTLLLEKLPRFAAELFVDICHSFLDAD